MDIKTIRKELGVDKKCKDTFSVVEAFRDELLVKAKALEKIVDGGEDMESVVVRSMFTRSERQELFSLYSTIQSIIWSSMSIPRNEKTCKKWLLDSWSKWKKIEKDVNSVISRVSDGWKNVKLTKTKFSYFY